MASENQVVILTGGSKLPGVESQVGLLKRGGL